MINDWRSYDSIAQRYDEIWGDSFEEVARHLWALISPCAGDSILDIGTGTGVVPRTRGAASKQQAVIGCDVFKSWLFGLRNLVGGESGSLQMVLTRARREALVRMLHDARELGASEVINVRFESSNILSGNPNRKRKGAMCAEIYAFGTAIVR